jgi:hypothetical protein
MYSKQLTQAVKADVMLMAPATTPKGSVMIKVIGCEVREKINSASSLLHVVHRLGRVPRCLDLAKTVSSIDC